MVSTIRYSANASSDHHPNQVPGILIIMNPKQPNLPTCSMTSTYLLFHLLSKPSLHLIANTIFGIIMTTIKISPKTLNHSILSTTINSKIVYFSLFLYALYPDKQARAITIGMTAYPALAVPLDVRTKIAPTNVRKIKTIDSTNNNFFIQSHSFVKFKFVSRLNTPAYWNLAVNYLSFSKEERIADPITTIARIGPN